MNKPKPPIQRYFVTLRVARKDPNGVLKLHKVVRTEHFVTLGEARTNLDSLMSSTKGRQEYSVGTIFRINKWNQRESIEHAVTYQQTVRQAYRTSLKWYTDVAPYILTSAYYKHPSLPPFRKGE